MNKSIIDSLSVIKEKEGYIIRCSKLHEDIYQVIYVNLNTGKTRVVDGTENICKKILKEYGIYVCDNISSYMV